MRAAADDPRGRCETPPPPAGGRARRRDRPRASSCVYRLPRTASRPPIRSAVRSGRAARTHAWGKPSSYQATPLTHGEPRRDTHQKKATHTAGMNLQSHLRGSPPSAGDGDPRRTNTHASVSLCEEGPPVIHKGAGLVKCHGLRAVGRAGRRDGRGGSGSGPVIHSAARGGPECLAGLEGSIKWAAVSRLVSGERPLTTHELARAAAVHRRARRRRH